MRDFVKGFLVFAGIALHTTPPCDAQTSGVLWIQTFSPGSSNLNDPEIDRQALATLDSLMQDPAVEVTFLGAADDLRWKMNGQHVHPNISEAWNDAKRLGRARIVRARYGRGEVGVTDENIAGVKVIWHHAEATGMLARLENSASNGHDGRLQQEIQALRDDVDSVKSAINSGRYTKIIEKKGFNLNWRLQGGVWSWYAGSDQNILVPTIGLNIIYERSAFVCQGGVAPWYTTTAFGKQGEAFLYAGIRHRPNAPRRGFSYAAGVFRGWEFFTATDSWSLKSTGVAAGTILSYKILELYPAVTYAYVDSIFKGRGWRFGSMIVVTLNLN